VLPLKDGTPTGKKILSLSLYATVVFLTNSLLYILMLAWTPTSALGVSWNEVTLNI